MGKNDQAEKILKQFDNSANRFCAETNGLYCDIQSEYKESEIAGNLKYRVATVVYPQFAVRFRYTAHGVASLVNSILECFVCPDKNSTVSDINLPFVIAYCNIETTAPLTIPLIYNEEGMKQAFVCIGGVLKDVLGKIAEIISEPTMKHALSEAFNNETDALFNNKTTDGNAGNHTVVSSATDSVIPSPYESHFFNTFITLRYTAAPFINLLAGRTDKAIRQLGKIKHPTSYEKHILNLLKSNAPSHPYDLSAILKNASAYSNSGTAKTDFGEFSAIFVSAIVMTIALSPVFCGIFFFLCFLEGRGSVYLLGASSNFPFCIFAAFIVSFGLSYFTRHKFYKLLHRKKYERYLEMDSIQNGPGADKFMKGFTVLLIIASLVAFVLFSKYNVNFREDGFVDNSKFLSVRGTFHSYDDIEYLYYKPDRVGESGDVLDFPSYVMVLRDKTEIDFYEFEDISRYGNTLIGYLRDTGIEIRETSMK